MKTITLLITAIALFITLNAQVITFQKKYGGNKTDKGYSVQQTTDGGYVIVGYTESYGAGKADVYLIKTDINGDMVWSKTYGGVNVDHGRSVQQTSDSGYIIAGETGANAFDLIKTDDKGNVEWSKSLEGDGRFVQQTSDGGYIVTGEKKFFSDQFLFLRKTDANGDMVWNKVFKKDDGTYGYCVRQTNDNGYIVAGYIYDYNANFGKAIYLIKTDVNGDSLWTKTIDGAGDDYARSIQQTTDGGYVVAGYTKSFGATLYDVYVVKLDANGTIAWDKTYGTSIDDYGYSIQQTTDGGYIIAGANSSGGLSSNMAMIKTDAVGDTMWTRRFHYILNSYVQEATFVQQTSDGGYALLGNSAQPSDIFLIKTDANGVVSTGIGDLEAPSLNVSVFPNPFYNKITVERNLTQEDLRLTLIDPLGRYHTEERLYGSYTQKELDVSELQPGIYFMQINSKDDFQTLKMVKY